jgi:hypothetical protein
MKFVIEARSHTATLSAQTWKVRDIISWYWTGQTWTHDLARAQRFDTSAEAFGEIRYFSASDGRFLEARVFQVQQ